ncbi:hypothetical protein SCATT_39520 [Streptantibioticus cattleyicolor NRRL 8057 = DSM 46488]|uniref:Uncharacterized protein n=1 Tax=Streptantibioticus cattleyicolor (strain ATCC 35852 / DSM 46488 / JCM 4925 / NBRC 14057 / NRRL 8057) TaxID=1003195 RepID=G8WUN0_STREN|nr:hypothetical protein SCATT_39520 [Streptantibioticus cattleyicolor NRRL 8057 = DSM 46488]
MTKGDGPLIPMPELDAESLRAAVEMIVPMRRPEFDRHMARAMHQARDTESLDPLRLFSLHWGMIIAIERWPERAARLRECERIAAEATDEERMREALAEIRGILDAAEREARRR